MDDETFSFWCGWKDARAGFPRQAEDQAEPDAYRAGYAHGSEGRVRDSSALTRTDRALMVW